MAYLRPANRVVRPLPRTTRRPPPRAVDPLLLQAGQVAAYRYMPQFAGLERLQEEAAGTRDQQIANAQAMAAGIAAAAEKARPALAAVYKEAKEQVEDSTDGISKHLGSGKSGHLFNKLSGESQAEAIGALSAGGALTQAALIDRTNNAQTQAAYANTASQRQYAGDLAKIQQTRQDVGAEQGQFLDVTYSQLRGERAKTDAQAKKDAIQQAYQNAQLGQGAQRLRLTAASQAETSRYHSGQLDIGAKNAATSAYRATHPSSRGGKPPEIRASDAKFQSGFNKLIGDVSYGLKTGWTPTRIRAQKKSQNVPDWIISAAFQVINSRGSIGPSTYNYNIRRAGIRVPRTGWRVPYPRPAPGSFRSYVR